MLEFTASDVEHEEMKDMLDGFGTITAGVAKNLARAFGTSVVLWLGLQAVYDSQEQL